MVDAMVATGATRSAPRSAAATRSDGVAFLVTGATAEAISLYDAVEREGSAAPAQSAAFARTWVQTVDADAIFATILEDGQPVFALALEVVRRGPFRMARLLGGTHANGNFAPCLLNLAGEPRALPAELIMAIRRARRDVDVLVLERLLPDLHGLANPLLSFPSAASPNPSLAVDLGGGFEALLARSSGRRKRKKHRSQTRKFEAAGGFARIEASSVEEIDRILGAFFEMKATRFRQAGIANVFGDPKVQAFFRRLFTDALPLSPKPFLLHALEVGGKLRAITGSSRSGDRIVCEFGAIVEDELAHASPGDFLFFENIKEACDQGLAVYDFSVGDELYKRLWCDIETQHRDALVPLSAKGRLLALSLHYAARLKASIKGDQRLWKLVKMLRRRGGGRLAVAKAVEA